MDKKIKPDFKATIIVKKKGKIKEIIKEDKNNG